MSKYGDCPQQNDQAAPYPANDGFPQLNMPQQSIFFIKEQHYSNDFNRNCSGHFNPYVFRKVW